MVGYGVGFSEVALTLRFSGKSALRTYNRYNYEGKFIMKRINERSTLAKFLLVYGLFSVPLSAISDTIRVGGGTAPIDNIFSKIKAAYEKESGNELVLTEDGPDMALIDVDQGKMDIATAGLGFNDFLDLVAKKNVTLKNKDAFKHRVIGNDKIQIYAHKDIGIKTLTKAQTKDIFTGKISNWIDVQGPNVPVTIVLGSKIPGIQKFFKAKVLDNQNYAKDGEFLATDIDEVLLKVATIPGAIGLGPRSLTGEASTNIITIQQPGLPPEVVGRPITAITNGPPSAAATSLFKFIDSKEGRALIDR